MTDPILEFFNCDHLPDDLKSVSIPFRDMAHDLVAQLPQCAERSVALRKLLEAKDAAVRARVSDRITGIKPADSTEF